MQQNKVKDSDSGPRNRFKKPDSNQKSKNQNKTGKDKIVKTKKIEPYIGDIDDPNLEDFIKDNEHLLSSYRVCFHSYRDLARSLFMLHNETMNVWSHLIGSLLFIYATFYVLFYLQPTSV